MAVVAGTGGRLSALPSSGGAEGFARDMSAIEESNLRREQAQGDPQKDMTAMFQKLDDTNQKRKLQDLQIQEAQIRLQDAVKQRQALEIEEAYKARDGLQTQAVADVYLQIKDPNVRQQILKDMKASPEIINKAEIALRKYGGDIMRVDAREVYQTTSKVLSGLQAQEEADLDRRGKLASITEKEATAALKKSQVLSPEQQEEKAEVEKVKAEAAKVKAQADLQEAQAKLKTLDSNTPNYSGWPTVAVQQDMVTRAKEARKKAKTPEEIKEANEAYRSVLISTGRIVRGVVRTKTDEFGVKEEKSIPVLINIEEGVYETLGEKLGGDISNVTMIDPETGEETELPEDMKKTLKQGQAMGTALKEIPNEGIDNPKNNNSLSNIDLAKKALSDLL